MYLCNKLTVTITEKYCNDPNAIDFSRQSYSHLAITEKQIITIRMINNIPRPVIVVIDLQFVETGLKKKILSEIFRRGKRRKLKKKKNYKEHTLRTVYLADNIHHKYSAPTERNSHVINKEV